MGPYEVNEDGKTLKENPDAWNKFASVVYIESPAGVGYSYASDGNTTTNDDITSLENYQAVKQFFTLYPSFRNHSTFIIGESYAGVYVPTLTARIVDGQADFPINLRGMALGNGYVHEKLNIDTSVRFAYGHGLIDEKVWNTLENECCRGCIDGCDLTKLSGSCAHLVEDIFKFLWFGGLNPYDLYRDCDPNPDINSVKMTSYRAGIIPSVLLRKFKKPDHPFKKYFGPRYGASVPCLNDSDVSTYMNDPEVRKALHIPDNLPRWDICSDHITENYGKIYGDMSPFIKKILKAQVRVLLYYGDVDMACNFMMGQQFAAQLGLPLRFAYGHGLIDEKVWNTLENECCRGCIDGCDLTKLSGSCAHLVEDIFKFLWFGGLNPYDLYRDCDPNPDINSVKMTSYRAGIIPSVLLRKFKKPDHPFKKYFGPRYGASVPCLNDSDVSTYMNDPEVRKALHIPDNLPRWDICSDHITENYGKIYGDMSPFIKKILKAQVRVLLYYGDVDMACNFMMGQQFSAQLGLPRQLNKTPWKYNKQIAGFKTQYKGLTFITIRGAGHMAPQWRAPETNYAIHQFLLNHPI
uniref:Serine carboxypeptidase n=2 Tax=Panagrolaimus sp. JU765 TaxID=591449 RepID=A0AC34QVK6_9BILA